MSALEGITVVEVSTRVAGAYAAKLLADFAAETIKVEPSGGCPLRQVGPFAGERSTLFDYLNTNKKSVELELDGPAGRVLLNRLLQRADALVTDMTPDRARDLGLDPATITRAHPHLVYCTITPYGWNAPPDRQNLRAINVMNASGWAYHTPSETPADKPPLKGAGRFMPDYEGGLEAALAMSASLLRKRQTGQGQWIDISEVATLLSRADGVLGRMLAGEQEPGPERTRYDMGGPGATFACADGFVFLVMTSGAHWKGICALMGNPDWTAGFPADWLEFHCTADRVAAFRARFAEWLLTQAKDQVAEAAQKLGVALVQVNTAADLPGHPQYRHRGYFQELAGRSYPTVPYRLTASPVRLRSPAPACGEHQGEIA